MLSGHYSGQPDAWGVRATQQLNTSSCAATFFPAALARGVVLWEPFGGLCAGLEMALRNGLYINAYYYSDIDPTAQRVARHRIRKLQTMYPHQLSETALAGTFSKLPLDVKAVTSQHLKELVDQLPNQQWLVVAGWPCQDLSTAGPSAGLQGKRSRLFADLVRSIGALQQLMPRQPPAYLIENVPFQHHHKQSIAGEDFQAVCRVIGQPTLIDAAQFGSLAHRARNYWSNMCTPGQLAATLRYVERPMDRLVQDILHASQ